MTKFKKLGSLLACLLAASGQLAAEEIHVPIENITTCVTKFANIDQAKGAIVAWANHNYDADSSFFIHRMSPVESELTGTIAYSATLVYVSTVNPAVLDLLMSGCGQILTSKKVR